MQTVLNKTMKNRLVRLTHLAGIRQEELRPLCWCGLYVFCVLSAYYVIRPVRDAFGSANGTHDLQWLFSATLIAMLVCNLPFAALSRRLSRQRAITLFYRFFIACLLLFALLIPVLNVSGRLWLGRVFFVWVSVFNLYVVSIFWMLIVDIFDSERGKRLFALMAAGATLGAIVGSLFTITLVKVTGAAGLFLLAAVLLELAVCCVRRLTSLAPQLQKPSLRADGNDEQPLGGGILSGIGHTFRSPYLLNICLYMVLFSVTSTFLYFRQAELARHAFSNDDARSTFFASLDLLVNVLTLSVQLLATGRLLSRFGTSLVLIILPAITVVGFLLLAWQPSLWVLAIFSVLRRASNFAIARPTRELLFTVLTREDKYKAKSFIDTAVYRAGDQVGAWSWTAAGMLGSSGPVWLWLAVPISVIWLLNSLWLGQRQQRLVPPPGE